MQVLDHLCGKCPIFQEAWEIQQNEGLPEPGWYDVISMLIKAGHTETAKYFSEASIKHDKRSEERINLLISNPPKGMIRCKTLGCDKQQISKCFNKRIKFNKKGTITNSPGYFLLANSKKGQSKPDLVTIGFTLDKDTGRPIRLNPNTFVQHVVNDCLDLVYLSGDRFYHYGHGIWSFLDNNNLRRKMRNIVNGYAPAFWSPSVEEKYIEALKLEAQRVEQMDSNRRFLNLENGMLDLKTYKLLDHDRKYFSTVRIPISYDPKAKCPGFLRFLMQVFNGDRQLVHIVAQMFGYCMTTEVKAQKAFILYGRGANGKSVLAKILELLVGKQNTCSLTLADLDKSFTRSEIVDKLLLLSTENEMGFKGLNTEQFKSIVAGDSIRAERKHQQGFTFEPFCKLVMGLNNLPYTRDNSEGFRRRLLILPFMQTFSGPNADVNLIDKLVLELPGIFNFALGGLKRLRKRKFQFTVSSAAETVLKGYIQKLNPISEFVEEHIEAGDSQDRILNKALSDCFRAWCEENGKATKKSNTEIADEVRSTLQNLKIPYSIGKTNKGRYTSGVRLKPVERTFPISHNTEVDSIDEIC